LCHRYERNLGEEEQRRRRNINVLSVRDLIF
jgi:hypothetical protein